MNELHADNLRKRIREHCTAFEAARAAADWQSAGAVWLQLLAADIVVREARAARGEADALAAELATFRPTREGRPAAPVLAGLVYVFTARAAWACVAVEVRTLVQIPAMFGGYSQEHFVPERKTLCGKAVSYPVAERFASGGWPRLHEVCPDCTRLLGDRGLLANPLADPAALFRPRRLPGDGAELSQLRDGPQALVEGWRLPVKLTVSVTEEDIENGNTHPAYCPIALAATRALNAVLPSSTCRASTKRAMLHPRSSHDRTDP